MKTENYTTKMIDYAQRILIDTSSLMRTDELKLLVDHFYHELVSRGKKIIILESVFNELNKFANDFSEERKKQHIRAQQALDIIKDYDEIFLIEQEKSQDNDFADRDIMEELLTHLTDERQLLISNDKVLAEDVNRFNSSQSIKVRKIMLCYLTQYGSLQHCDCIHVKNNVQTDIHVDRISLRQAVDIKTDKFKYRQILFNISSVVMGLLLGYGVAKKL